MIEKLQLRINATGIGKRTGHQWRFGVLLLVFIYVIISIYFVLISSSYLF